MINTKDNSMFWQKYRASVTQQGISETDAQWLEHWARQFSLSIPDKPLRNRTFDDIKAFLGNLESRSSIKEWQVNQAKKALKILYQDFFELSWAQTWPAEDTLLPVSEDIPKGAPERALPQPVPEPIRKQFRDETLSKDVYVLFRDIFEKLENEMSSRHYSARTAKLYQHWTRRFTVFHGLKPPHELSPDAVNEYLEYLAVERRVSAISQKQALNALVFLYEQVLTEPLGTIGDFTAGKQTKDLAVVISVNEASRLLDAMQGVCALTAGLIYGAGLRLIECLRLRVKDLDFEREQIIVRNNKGMKDREVPIPERVRQKLQEHLVRIKEQHEKDLSLGFGEVYIWPTLSKKYPEALRQWIWQYVFPSSRLLVDHQGRRVGRHHIQENTVQKAVKTAALKAGLSSQTTCQTLRNSFAVHLLEKGYDIRVVKDMLGLSDSASALISKHVMKKSGVSAKSLHAG